MNSNQPLYIRGWKGLEAHTGFAERTLREWHYKRVRCPIIKLKPNSHYSRWVTTPDRVALWLLLLNKVPKIGRKVA